MITYLPFYLKDLLRVAKEMGKEFCGGVYREEEWHTNHKGEEGTGYVP